MSLQQAMPILLALVMVKLLSAATAATETTSIAKPGCDDRCGNVSIPYPFGTTGSCSLAAGFLITCNRSFDPPLAFLQTSEINVTKITLEGKLHIQQFIAHACFDELGRNVSSNRPWLLSPNFPISTTGNKFTAVGCDTYGYLRNSQANYSTGCITSCDNVTQVPNGTCSGIGCCQSSIPKGISYFSVRARSFSNHTRVWEFNPCSYAFIVEEDAYKFNAIDLLNLRNEVKLPMLLDWAIGNETCQVAKQKEGYLCGQNSICNETDNGDGYRCYCSKGYQGNPYLANGCQDIDECDPDHVHNCVSEAKCENIPGDYLCRCPKGYHGDGMTGKQGCEADRSRVIQIIVGFSACIIVLLVGSTWLYWVFRKRKLIRLKERFFQENGGLILQQQLYREGPNVTFKIFTSEELEKATNKYDESTIIGQGGNGTVYKGILADNRTVAIKKSKIADKSQIEQFINEVVVVSQINHRNVVKLLGCCLESQVPLLVYEFISNGTLFDHIHNEKKASTISWENRLRVAAETAGVLSYLHSSASVPIIHRDIKSTNILLDDSYAAKVTDFGASRLVPPDQNQMSTMVQGTLGYLDPEYLHTTQLTEKSDVYSFGVVLVELLTGRQALSFHRPEEERCLAMCFLSFTKTNRLFQLIDERIVTEVPIEELNEFAELGKRCLRVKGEERPTMKEVAMELEGLIMRKTMKHPWVNIDLNSEETEYLLDNTASAYGYGSSSNTTAVYDSMRDHIVLPVAGVR